MGKFYGVIPPVITIFDDKGNIDIGANRRHLDFLISNKIHGVAYLGTTGEFGSLTLQEKKWFLQEMSTYCSKRIPILAGISDTCLTNVLELAQHCEQIGIDGLLLLPPYFSVYSAEMTASFFSTVAASTRLPIVLYNFPALTGFDMTVEWVSSLAQRFDTIIGIKETVSSLEHIRKMMSVKQARHDFLVFAAFDDQFLEAKRLGVDGFIPASANCFPECSVDLWNKPDELQFQRIIRAQTIYQQTLPLYLGVKEAVYQREKFNNCSERLPAMTVSSAERKKIQNLLRAMNVRN